MYFKLCTSDGKNSINETPKQGQEQWKELYLWYVQVNYKLKNWPPMYIVWMVKSEEIVRMMKQWGDNKRRDAGQTCYHLAVFTAIVFLLPACMHTGVGKSSVAACLSMALAETSAKVGQYNCPIMIMLLLWYHPHSQAKWSGLGMRLVAACAGGGTSLCVAVLARDQVLFHHGHIRVNSVAWDL